MKKTYLASTICKTAGEAILISYTVDFRKETITRNTDKKNKRINYKEDITNLKVYVPNNRDSK